MVPDWRLVGTGSAYIDIFDETSFLIFDCKAFGRIFALTASRYDSRQVTHWC